jgi:hypothetical protein
MTALQDEKKVADIDGKIRERLNALKEDTKQKFATGSY